MTIDRLMAIVIILVLLILGIAMKADAANRQITGAEYNRSVYEWNRYLKFKEAEKQEMLRINKQKRNWASYSKAYRRNPEPSNPHRYMAAPPGWNSQRSSSNSRSVKRGATTRQSSRR